MREYGLKSGERIAARVLIYVEEWCDGNGNLGPCSCAGDSGHWRLGRTISLEELMRSVADAQREACAQFVGRYSGETIRTNTMNDIRETPLVTEEKP